MWMPLRAPKMKRLHLRVPALGLVAEVDAGFHHLADGDRGVGRGRLADVGAPGGRCRWSRSWFPCCSFRVVFRRPRHRRPKPAAAMIRSRARTVASAGVWCVERAVGFLPQFRHLRKREPQAGRGHRCNSAAQAAAPRLQSRTRLQQPDSPYRRSRQCRSRSPPENRRHPPRHGQARHPAARHGRRRHHVHRRRRGHPPAGSRKPIGSLTQMGTIRLGKRTDDRSPLIKDFVPLAELDDIVFGGWDIFPDDALRGGAARPACSNEHLARSSDVRARAIKPMTGGVRPAST